MKKRTVRASAAPALADVPREPAGGGASDREPVRSPSRDGLSSLFSRVARALRPAVVEVRVTERVRPRERQGPAKPGAAGAAPRSKRPQPREFLMRGLGSGVIVDAAGGCIVTNFHVVTGSEKTEVLLPDGRTLEAEWIRSDPMTDLAVLKVPAGGLTQARLGDSDEVVVGEWVLAIGCPEALPQTVTAGIISGTCRSTGEDDVYQDFLQTDAAINVGNSGGPLVNMRGEVIGINTSIVSVGGGSEGIGFAIPSNMVRRVMGQLIEKGKVVRGHLGVSVQGVDDKLAISFGLPTLQGALVASVTPGGPADRAGLRDGDFIVSVSGRPVAGANALRNLVAAQEPGRPAALEFYRGGRRLRAAADIEPQGNARRDPPRRADALKSRFGLAVETAAEAGDLGRRYGYAGPARGALIVGVVPGSSAEEAGLEEGMTITRVHDKDIDSSAQLRDEARAASGGVRLRVVDPSGTARFVFLSPSGS